MHACTRNGEIDLLSPPFPSHRTRIVSCHTMSTTLFRCGRARVSRVHNERNAWRRSRATLERINGMQFEPPVPVAIDSHRERNKDAEERRGTGTFHVTNRDITPRKMSSPPASGSRTKEHLSITLSLSRNGPARPLDFTLRSRYETISISFAKGPPSVQDFLRYFLHAGFAALYGPLYLALLPSRASPPSPPPFSRLDQRTSRRSTSRAYERIVATPKNAE